MIRMSVEGVGFDNAKRTVVVLKDWEGKKLLPIWIGPAEARAIAIEMEGTKPGRPLSHDLLLGLVALSRGRITRVVINDLQDSVFFATIDVETPTGVHHIDARPSDAIAVAVRAKCPVFVDGAVKDALVDADEVEDMGEPGESGNPSLSVGEDIRPDDEIERFRRLLGDDPSA